MSLISHTYNVTTEENITELEEEITYDVTELRMDPDYIRFVHRENVELDGYKFHIRMEWI